MKTSPTPARALAPTAALIALLLTACTPAADPADTRDPAGTTAPAGSAAASARPEEAPGQAGPGDPQSEGGQHGAADLGHIHGLHPDGEDLLTASHHGLFVGGLDGVGADGLMPDGSGPEPRGPLIDLMGFTAGADVLYASGHPGAGTALPNPVGLLRSDDGGATWEPLSRTGQSDFHALTAASGAVIGFDGSLVRTEDGQSWTEVEGPDAFALAGHPGGPAVLATTQTGVWRSDDAGLTWSEPAGGPVLQYVAFAAPDTAVGIAPDGVVHVSRDAGRTWEKAGDAGEQPGALAAEVRDGELHVWAAVGNAVVHSDDGGATFTS
ncbi:F510_1955 family glycosylhydrolase [Zhihengliuella sp.]|uniref:F510_1955 family glycosylhydrolase n=1 Tax=Zhihengliuella sp. TaxID=1954483 RepID=UPI0028121879|nr:exo-alpha-sialidase [Zhihengliuella sp.]